MRDARAEESIGVVVVLRPGRVKRMKTVMSQQALMPERTGAKYFSAATLQARLRVDGKYFARGSEHVRVRGVTYGPFAPRLNGEQFPAPVRVVDDFALMQAIGINAIRTY